MSKVIAIAGKGGTGKTTIAGLLIRYLVRNGMRPVLAVDADADTNLPETIGMSAGKSLATIGATREDFFVNRDKVPAGMPKEAWLEMQLSQALVESTDVDLIVMGRPEGAGCYCYINNMLRKHLEVLGKNYPYVIIDNEAGLEHLSRRTAQNIDFLLVVSDYSLNGLRAAVRVRELAAEMKLEVGRSALIVNNTPEQVSAQFEDAIGATGVEFLGYVPADRLVPEFDISGKPITALSDDSIAVKAVNIIAQKLLGAAQSAA